MSGMITHILHQKATRVIRKYPKMSYVGVLISSNGDEGRFWEGVAEEDRRVQNVSKVDHWNIFPHCLQIDLKV